MAELQVRQAVASDLEAITAIYAHHVAHGTGTFATEAPDLSEMTAKWAEVIDYGLPYLVAARSGVILGYAYAAPFRTRAAYRYMAEDSLYIHPDHMGQGVGSALMVPLMDHCRVRGLHSLLAVIGDRANQASIRLHARHGFVETGFIPDAGYKLGRWLDVVMMSKALRPKDAQPEAQGWLG